MGAFSSKGTTIRILKSGATPVETVPTAITKASPAVVTVADTTGMSDGDYVVMKDTGFPELDGRAFVVKNLSGTDFELKGSDTTGSSGSLGANPKAHAYPMNQTQIVCLSGFTVNNTEPSSTSVGTFCDPSASLPSAVQEAGTINVTGYINDKDLDYQEMLMLTETGEQTWLFIELPGGHGSLVAPVSFGAMGFEIPLEGAPGWSATGVLGSRFRHVY